MNFNATPISFSEKLNSARDSQGKPWVLTSATLSMNGNFDHFVEEMGLEDAKTKHWDSPFDYKSQALLYIPDDIPQPGVPDFRIKSPQKSGRLSKRIKAERLFCARRFALWRRSANICVTTPNVTISL